MAVHYYDAVEHRAKNILWKIFSSYSIKTRVLEKFKYIRKNAIYVKKEFKEAIFRMTNRMMAIKEFMLNEHDNLMQIYS